MPVQARTRKQLRQSIGYNLGAIETGTTYDAGSTTDGMSDEEIAATVTATGATAQWRILRLSEDPSNSDTGSANSNWIVRLNESVYYNNGVLT